MPDGTAVARRVRAIEDMATNHSSRRNDSSLPATAGAWPVAPVRSLLLSIVALVALAAALLAGSQFAGQHLTNAAPAPEFLGAALGSPKSSATLVRKPAHDLRVAIGTAGYSVTRGGHSVALSSSGAGASGWQRFAHGASRTTPFGSETVTVSPRTTEQVLVVDRHQGTKTWAWDLGLGGL